MIAEKRLTWKTVPLLLVGLLVFFLYLYFLGLDKIAASLQSTNLVWYSLAFIIVTLNMLLYSLAWLYFLRSLSVKASLKDAFIFTWVGNFVDLLVPAETVSGEISKAYLMSRSSGGENAGKVVASVVSHRILNMTITLTALIVGSLLFIVNYPVEISGFALLLLSAVIFGTAIAVVFLIIICMKESITEKISDWILRFAAFISRGRWQLTNLRSRTRGMLKAFHHGIKSLGKSPKALILPVVLTLAAWFLNLLVPFLTFVSIGHSVDLSVIIIVYSLSFAIRSIPIGVPGDVGLTESVMTGFYILLGVPSDISAASTILAAIATIGFKLLVGYVAVQWVGVKILTRNT
jgi:uncharacterized protein (TIRG00374 family)